MNENLRLILFHEIGHYIAIELNQKTFKTGYGVEKIILKLFDLNDDSIKIPGVTIAIEPENYRFWHEIKNPAQYIAGLVYGCIFETILIENVNFYYCFNGNEKATGNEDFREFNNYINKKLSRVIRDKLVTYFVYFIEEMKLKKGHFQKLNKIDFSDLLIKNELGYSVDLLKLEIKLLDFKNEHSPYYEIFVEQIKKIID